MSGDSFPLALPLGQLEPTGGEVSSLYRELRRPLLRYLVCLGLSADEAQDVIQDAFLTLHRQLSAGGSKDNVRGWLFRVAHNGARNRQKRYERRCTEPLRGDGPSIADAVTPEDTVMKRERFRRLNRALRELTDRERECVLLRAEGLRYREIGDVLNIPTSTVADVVERAIRKLAEPADV